MAQPLTRINRLERELHLRQLQVRRLLQITQAINNNVAAEDLFQMYRGFLRKELGVNEMALFVRESEQDERWQLVTSIGLEGLNINTGLDFSQELDDLKRATVINRPEHQLFRHFEHVVPVLHKERPIAYILIGTFTDEDDMFERVQIITTISNVIAVAIENKRLFKRQIEQERLEADLDLGAKVQAMLIPKQLPTNDFYELSAIYRPKLGVGGDYFDYREFVDGKLVFCIGDFTGKGVSAALLMANFQANFHTLIRKRTDLYDFVTEINESVYRITNGERFVTFFVAEYDRQAHTLSYVNAGHPPPVLVSESSFQLLETGTTVLGSIDKLPVLEVGHVVLPTEALLITYTDGLTDLLSPAGEAFEEDILHQFARRQYARSASDFNQNLLDYLEEFREGNPYPDDLTILSCRIFGSMPGS